MSANALDWQKIEKKWQQKWAAAALGKSAQDKKKQKFMMIFAYPGISGYLHVGHMRGFSYTDAICRFERLRGKEVLFPVGTHASGNQAIAFAQKVSKKDPQWLEYLKRNGCPESRIKDLARPENVVQFFNHMYVNEYWKKFGFLCDWERFTCTTNPDYEKFIQWQFKKLQQKNLLVQKPYFATACIACGPVAVDPSETDIAKGGKAEKVEYTLLKFKVGNVKADNVKAGNANADNDYLIAATLRPETVFGQTNLWVNPEAKHCRVEVGLPGRQETWIMTEEAAEKLQYQKDDLLLKENVDIKQYLGKYAIAPGIERKIPILPSSLPDPKIGTGIVTSVPGDAPYDYMALKKLQDNMHEVHRYGLNMEAVQDIDLIPIIATKGYGEFPAKEIVEKMGITSLDDPKLEEATKEIYKAGHHTGIMRGNCGKYAGMKVEDAKELVKAELLQQGNADIFHDLSEEVICRCGNKVVVKRIDDQWFIRYSDPELTEKSKEHVQEMAIFPEEYKKNLPAVLDWFQDRACARLGNWLGSRLPFDNKWIIEPISDSTLYPAYYVVSKYINDGTLQAEELTEEFFDYVFLGTRNRLEKQNTQGKEVTGKEAMEKESTGTEAAGMEATPVREALPEKWKAIREEFEYFYPLDINLGGKEHQTVHFPVFLMNHVAILPKEKWPRGIFVNWWVTGGGSKISKSKGGAEPIPDAIQKYGVDAMRLYYAHSASPHADVVWEEEQVLKYKQALERMYQLAAEMKALKGQKGRKRQKGQIDAWLLSRLQHAVEKAGAAMKDYNLRELASLVYFSLPDDFRWYLRRGGSSVTTLRKVLSIWAMLMNPITPHLSEELSPGRKLVSAAAWPEVESKAISLNAEAGEEMLHTLLEDMRAVMSLAKVATPAKCTLFPAERWKYEVCALVARELKVTRNMGEIMRRVLQQEELKLKGKEISALVTSLMKDPSKLPAMLLSPEEELAALLEAKEFLQQEWGCAVEIMEENTHPKAKAALPGKPGMLVE